MSAVCMTVNGVIRKVAGGSPIPVGRDLYYALATRFTLLLLANHADEQNELQHWLELEGMNEHATTYYPDVVASSFEMPNRRLQQVVYCVRQSHDIQLVIDPDPEVCALIFFHGYNTMPFTHAEYSLPEWRPDYNKFPYEVEGEPQLVTPWNELAHQVAHNAKLRATDERLKIKDVE